MSRLDRVRTREQIGRELHDTVVQNLFAIGLELLGIAAECPDAHGERIERVAGRLDEVIASIRDTVLAPAPTIP
ncbi:histidine kinase, partial [Enterococcus hirae]